VETITIRVQAFNSGYPPMIHRAHKCYTNLLQNCCGMRHIVDVVAHYRFTLFMFISTTPVAIFVLHIGYELIRGVRGGILLNQFVGM
jgi:hypothetical protein